MNGLYCPLCSTIETGHYHQSPQGKIYYRCLRCELTFLDPKHRLSTSEEKARYDQHQNDPTDPDYRAFLSKLINSLKEQLKAGERGLDFGCGPGPTISAMLKENNIDVKNYDPIYFPNQELLNQKYDFITCTEVLEHCFEPRQILQKLMYLLNSSGYLGIMTEFREDHRDFSKWYYKNDPSHVCFYKSETFDWISSAFGLEIIYREKNIVIFKNSV